MSIYPSPDKLDKFESKYALVILAAKRSRQIKDGAARFVQSKSPNPLTVALEEIAEGYIVPRHVDDPSAMAHQKALKPNEPSLEDIIGAGPVIALDTVSEEVLDPIAAFRNAEPDAEDEDEMLLHADDEEVRPMDEFVLETQGLLVNLDDDEDDLDSVIDEGDEE
jgi:DNA-directed RNA polymerase subunit omega